MLGFCSFELHAYEERERVLRGFFCMSVCDYSFQTGEFLTKGGDWLFFTGFLLLLGVVLLEGASFVLAFFPVGAAAAWPETNGNHTPVQNKSDDGDQILLSLFQW